ncbi:hypothetical protein C2G38_2317485 [Gigaspora rosea]|uniref:Zn(2)-C6 fungal-type domain-containing protein n=1 Tax=Gigaspora rosea TaxID=44941 RepID=A0A397W7L7_9GLOM|nr:hypothetical protein C2G38_2317485 [Gigaspora rosea]CAG8474293.1 5628_t:CDS:2 [Gigaspora rosea]
MSTLATSAIDASHLGSYNGNASESSQMSTLQDLLQVGFAQRSGSHHYFSPISHSRTPTPIVPTNSTMLHYNNHHASPKLVDSDELRSYEDEMLKYYCSQPIISASNTLDAIMTSNVSAPEAMKIDNKIPDWYIINESYTGPFETEIMSFKEQEKISEVLPIICFDTTKIPFTISDQFSRTIPDSINSPEPLQNFYQLYSNASFTNIPKYQDDSQHFRKAGKDAQQRRQRSPYVTKACTNCRQKHAKCSGKAICKYCMLHNLECIFIDSGKKRGPRTKRGLRTNSIRFEANYISNGSEITFDEISMSFVPSNILQSYALTSSYNNDITFYSDSYSEL